MTTLLKQIEDMRIRVSELSAGEHTLIRALADALSRADDRLLQAVRQVTTEHEARRAAILQELQGLAARIGAFPSMRETAVSVEEAHAELPSYSAPLEDPHSLGRGDWRQAASKIQDEIDFQDFHLNGHAPSPH
jgi:hypothetical protein